MKVMLLILLFSVCFTACDFEGYSLPTKGEIIKAAQKAGATNVVVTSYMYSNQWGAYPSINTDGGFKNKDIRNVLVRITYSGTVANTAVEKAIRQLFINNNFSSSDNTVYANTTDIPQPPAEETYALPSRQTITEAVQNFGATSVTIAAYTVSGNNVTTDGATARSNAAIVIRVNYSYNGLGTVIPSQAAVILAIRELFTGFTNVTASVSPTAMYPLPSHSFIIEAAGEQGANNTKIIEYTANSEVIGEFLYGSRQSNTPIRISITYDVGANVTLVGQAVRGLFQHFTNVTIITMLAPPTREEIENELIKEGATSVNLISYTIAGSNASVGLRATNVAIHLEVYYTTSSASSNGIVAVKNLFYGFTNTNIYVGNDIPINLPTQYAIANVIYTNEIEIVSINTYTVNGVNGSILNNAISNDNIIIRARAEVWVYTGPNWNSGYWRAINNNSDLAIAARARVIQLFNSMGFNPNKISVTFE
jgi:hypothetical protein